jgi:hypothetical protein
MTIKLSKTQIAALKSGAAHKAGHITLPATLRGGARQKVVTALTNAELVVTNDDALVITSAGLSAIGADPAKPAKQPRLDTKQAQLIAMMRRPEGVTIDEAVERLDWQAHTVRGAIAGALKKKLGLDVVSERADGGRKSIYRIAG